MATRNLTESFILMRNNALQSRHIFSDQMANDRMALVSSEDRDVEHGIAVTKNSRLPPEWADIVEEIQFEISRINPKMKDLSVLHDKHLNRPTLDDSVDEEHAIEIQTQDITQMLMRCERLIQQINARCRQGSAQQQRLTRNIASSLAQAIQEISTNFRQSQSTYLKKLKYREERSNQYFGVDFSVVDGGAGEEADISYERGFTSQQLQTVEESSALGQQREHEILQIVKSIHDLNTIFKDLAGLVVDQGTLLDRIDYNIEQTSVSVHSGLQQLHKAERHQKNNRKMACILVLFVVIVLLVLLLIIIKS